MAKNKSPDGTGSGPSQRQLRVGELLRRHLSQVLSRGDIHDPDLNRMVVTIGEVRVSPDLRVATIYACPLGGQKPDDMIQLLKRNAYELRRSINKGLALKYSPELRFRLDETYDRLDETRRLLSDDTVRRDIDRAADPDDDAPE